MNTLGNFPFLASFLAGFATFISPCVLPLIPVYITFITGASLDELKNSSRPAGTAFFNSVCFVLGFGLVFVLLGASASFLGGFLSAHRDAIRWAGGIIVIIFGIHISGLFPIKFFYMEKRVEMKKLSLGYFGSFVVGLVFALGWTPCVGPILSSILILASTQETVYRGVALLSCYSLGLGIPFILTAVFIERSLILFASIKKYFRVIEIVSGAILVLLGVLMISNGFKLIFVYFNKLFY
jgi:cytochrome c-type biogenesis protein